MLGESEGPRRAIVASSGSSWPVAQSEPEKGWAVQNLFEAAGCGKLEDVKWAVGKGADVNARNKWMRTPLMHAAFQGSVATVRYLLRQGADPNAVDDLGMSVLGMAYKAKKYKVAKVLKEHGAKNGDE